MADEVDRFQAVADDGEEFTVIVYRQTIKGRDLDGTEWTKLGLPDLALVDGSAVNQIDTETFQIVETDKIIRKVG